MVPISVEKLSQKGVDMPSKCPHNTPTVEVTVIARRDQVNEFTVKIEPDGEDWGVVVSVPSTGKHEYKDYCYSLEEAVSTAATHIRDWFGDYKGLEVNPSSDRQDSGAGYDRYNDQEPHGKTGRKRHDRHQPESRGGDSHWRASQGIEQEDSPYQGSKGDPRTGPS